MDELKRRYIEKFGDLPLMPIMVNRGLIRDLMEEAIERGTPVTQEEIRERVKKIKEPIDIEITEVDDNN